MKRLFILIVYTIMTMTMFAQKTLSERQLLLCACASLEAQGDMQRLQPAIHRALDGGVTINELKEAFSQLYAYTGFPRSLNALGTLQKVLDERKAQGKTDNEGKEWKRPVLWDNAEKALKQGTEVQAKLVGGKPFNYEFCPQDDYYLKAHLFGDIFAGDQLSASDRELVTVAALSSLKGVESQLASHKAGAVNMGNTKEQVDELCRWLSKNGYSQMDCSADAEAGAWAKGIPNPYGQFFTGQSYLATIQPANVAEGASTLANYQNVTFEPGCRNNWHIHHGAHQILVCVSGRGWYQEWGKEPIALLPGMIIDIPNEVKHWHGAQKDSWFQHLSCIALIGEGKESHEWLEPVSDEQYLILNNNQDDMNTLTLTQEWDKVFPLSEKVAHRKVTFETQYGLTLAADLYTPKNAQGKLAAIAVSGPFGATKEQSSGLYAMKMAERGFVALAFDPSYTGESSGEPRRTASPDINTEDFMAAVDFLSKQENVDAERIGIIGICGWGGIALNVAATDTRIKATVSSTMYDMTRVSGNGYFDADDNEQSRHAAREVLSRQRLVDPKKMAGGVIDPLPDDVPQFVKDYHDYYKTPRGYHVRSGNSNDGWRVIGTQAYANARFLYYTNEIRSAVLIMHGEKAHSLYFGKDAYKYMVEGRPEAGIKPNPNPENKELLIIPNATHCDLYDGGYTEAKGEGKSKNMIPWEKLAEFFNQYLNK